MVRNDGDALADEVVVKAVLPDGIVLKTAKFFLDGGDEERGRLPVVIGADAPGEYALPLIVDYADGKGLKHETFAWVRHWVGEIPGEVKSPVDAKLSPPELDVPHPAPYEGFSGRGTLALTAMSFTNEMLDVRLRVLLPGGLEVEKTAPTRMKIPADGVGYVEIGITNAATQRDGVVPAAVLLEFETSDGRNHSVDVMTTIRTQGILGGHDAEAPSLFPKEVAWVLFAVWLVIFANRARRRVIGTFNEAQGSRWAVLDAVVVVGLTLYLAVMLNVQLAFLDTLCVGGDTPAHHYLMSHIGETNRIVSWAPGWWSGFPMFRYYFPLPYVAMSALSHVMPHNVAFKLCSIWGLLVLPTSFYLSGRMLRLPRPAPAVLACLAIPIVFDNTHSMWGVNAYSTLAGMIANSWSFALMIPAMASACRDALDGRFRCGTVVLLSAMLLSHFFTSMMAASVLALLMLALAVRKLRSGDKTPLMKQAWFVLFREGVCVLLLTAWWVVPLMARRAWAVDFGAKWDIAFFRQLPPVLHLPLLVACVFGLVAALGAKAFKNRGTCSPMRLWMFLHIALLAWSLAFFYGGTLVSDVFVNCRFWPFIVYSMLMTGALAFSYASRTAGMMGIGMLLALSVCLAFAWKVGGKEENPIWSKANHVGFWTEYNFRGVENLREGHVVAEIADRLRGTGGRMSQDLHPGNEWLGSSRIFETMPYLCGKPMIEGGIVNSAIGSLAAYTLQGEVSDNPAGWPLLVKPRKFDPASGLRHLEFMGVRQFVARSRKVQKAFGADAGWRLAKEFGGGKWKLFESTLGSASPVRVWNEPLTVCETEDFQGDLLEWMYVPAAVSRPVVLMDRGTPPPPGAEVQVNERYVAWLAELSRQPPPQAGWLDACSVPCEDFEQRVDGSLRFTTDHIGKPHVVAVSYFPDWRATGAERVYFLTPGYLAVYPTGREVILYHGKGAVLWTAEALTLLGVVVLLLSASHRMRNAGSRKTVGNEE